MDQQQGIASTFTSETFIREHRSELRDTLGPPGTKSQLEEKEARQELASRFGLQPNQAGEVYQGWVSGEKVT